MLPAFGGPEIRALLSSFQGCAKSMSNKWMDMMSNSKEQSVVLDIHAWLSRATLDAVGEAAFDARFGCMDENESPLVQAYNNLVTDIFSSPSDMQILFQGVSRYIPLGILKYIGNTSKNSLLVRMREVSSAATVVAKQMVEEKAAMLLQGKGSRDVFSLLIKANMDTEAKAKLTEEELFAQMRTILFTGQEMTSKTISWAVLELAKHPEIQSRLRAEIRETDTAVHARGDADFTIADFDAMPYTTAVIKEVLRFCPVLYHSCRYATEDDVLPLSEPVTTRSGEVIHELPVSKGTWIVVSLAGYNRNKDLWGENAHVFDPERWLSGAAKEKKATGFSVYSDLGSFGGGTRACIGWRFAVIEIQAFLTEIIGKFELTLTDKSKRIRREACVVMAPTVEGEVENGIQLPLRVSVAPRTE
ncbi:hypothetical protein AZE42_00989 [Rhizopogon vesiculosus]|uniref:Cytochrome P450 n=1 Tax=Rhizopogon vesiculosus TaxID=180088 RepID=A0A1J8PGL4_9AGAM|nr:hypothetical protein AZE42_00989 [Rhizopogon vesiculosus]